MKILLLCLAIGIGVLGVVACIISSVLTDMNGEDLVNFGSPEWVKREKIADVCYNVMIWAVVVVAGILVTIHYLYQD